MSALDKLQSLAAVVNVGDSKVVKGGVRVTILGIPVYDDGWAGVQRRKARREARRARR